MTTDARDVRPRVVSLLPAGTEIVAALGALDSLVGITHECDFPPEVSGLPRVTASAVDRDAGSAEIDAAVRELASAGMPVFALDADDLVRLAPTLILTQTLCEVCAVSEGDVRAIGDLLVPAPRILALGGTSLDGVWEDISAVGAALCRSAEAADLLASVSARLRAVHETLKAARAPRRRVVVIEWLQPLYAAGHWTPEVVRRAGGIDGLAEPGTHSRRVSLDEVRAADPELILVAPCGFDVARAEQEGRALLDSAEWSWARERSVWALDGNALTSRAGPRLADAVEVISAIVAPALFAPPRTDYARSLNLTSP
ncbi:MAG: ABC transporter substrate-binding protein [Gemmatimonadaceae bacterium]